MLRGNANPFTQEQLAERENCSMQDYRAGKCTTQEQPEKVSEN
jgi:hypothetical protein